MKFAYDISEVPRDEPTNNGWLNGYYSVKEEAEKMFAEGAICVAFEEGTCAGLFFEHVDVFSNDGEYVHFFEIDFPPGFHLAKS